MWGSSPPLGSPSGSRVADEGPTLGQSLTLGQSPAFLGQVGAMQLLPATRVAVADSLATGICLGLFILQKETEDYSMSESCTAASPTT